jgi:hypothetical protein
MEIILLAALVIILVGTYAQLAHMRRSHNKAWKAYGHRHTFTQIAEGVYQDDVTDSVHDLNKTASERIKVR